MSGVLCPSIGPTNLVVVRSVQWSETKNATDSQTRNIQCVGSAVLGPAVLLPRRLRANTAIFNLAQGEFGSGPVSTSDSIPSRLGDGQTFEGTEALPNWTKKLDFHQSY